jgi:hypothetical protein
VVGLFGLAGNVGLSNAIKQAGSSATQLYATSYDQNLLDSPTALAATQGTYSFISDVNFTPPSAAAQTMLDNLGKYTQFKGGIPNLNIVIGYLASELMVTGLQMAGPTGSRSDFISKLRTVSSWNANGLLTSPTTFTGFGTVNMLPATSCAYYVKISGNTFQPSPTGGKPICGDRVAVP